MDASVEVPAITAFYFIVVVYHQRKDIGMSKQRDATGSGSRGLDHHVARRHQVCVLLVAIQFHKPSVRDLLRRVQILEHHVLFSGGRFDDLHTLLLWPDDGWVPGTSERVADLLVDRPRVDLHPEASQLVKLDEAS